MNLHVIIGEDDYLVSEAARKIVGDGVGLEVIDSMNSTNAESQLRDLREAEASLMTPPFLDPKKVTWWRNVHFLPGGGRNKGGSDGGEGAAATRKNGGEGAAATRKNGGEGTAATGKGGGEGTAATGKGGGDEKDESIKASLERFAERLSTYRLPENQHFILTGPKLLKTSIFAKRITAAVKAKTAEFQTFETEKPWAAAESASFKVVEMAAGLGLKLSPDVAAQFVAVVGADTRSLMSELAKLRDYLGADGEKSVEVRAEDVAEISCAGFGAKTELWDVTDAVGRRDMPAALKAMHKFELEKGFAVMMTNAFERFFRQLLDVMNGRTEGMVPFVVRKNQGFLRNWTARELAVARARFLDLREKVVSGLGDIMDGGQSVGDILVSITLVRVMRRQGVSK